MTSDALALAAAAYMVTPIVLGTAILILLSLIRDGSAE